MAIRKRRVFGIAALACFVVVGTLAGYSFYRDQQAASDVAVVMAALDRDEPGWRLADLEHSRTPVPADQDAGPLILKLKRQVPREFYFSKERPEDTWQDLPPGEPLPRDQVAIIELKMAMIGEVLPQIRGLADRPHGRFHIVWTPDIIGTLIPHVQEVREMAFLLLCDTYAQVHESDYNGALVSCRAILRVGRTLEEEPLIISQLVHAVCVRFTIQGAQHTLASGEATDQATLAALQQALVETDRLDPFIVAMRGERAGLNEMFCNLENGTVSLSFIIKLLGPVGGVPSFFDKAQEIGLMSSVRISHAWVLNHIQDIFDATKLPPNEQPARMKALNSEPGNGPALAKLLMPALTHCHETFRRNQARLRCAIIGLAAERYRFRHGHWPADLAALTPEFLKEAPLDPFTGNPLKWRKVANGIVIHSVGPDGTRRGDFFDQATPSMGPGPAGEAALYEFRLWDPAIRGLPLAARK